MNLHLVERSGRLMPFLMFVILLVASWFENPPAAAADGVVVHGSRLIIVLVLDGLRPDSINVRDTLVLNRLRSEGVEYRNTHSVFPTVTRVNAAALVTGTYPGLNGLVSNFNVCIPLWSHAIYDG